MSTQYYLSALLLAVAFRAGAQETAPAPPSTTSQPVTAASTGGAAPTFASEPVLSTDELIAKAFQNNPQIPIAQNTLDAARARVDAVRTPFNPTLQVVPGLGGDYNSRNPEIILSQPLDLFGQRRASRGVLEAQVRRAQAEQTLAQRTLVVSVKNAAADLFAAQEAENLGQAQVGFAQALRDAAARRAQLGDAPAVQTERAQIELDRALVDLESAQSQRLSRRATLNQIIGQAPQTPLRVSLPELPSLSLNPGATTPGAVTPGSVTPSASTPLPGGGTSATAGTSTVPSVSSEANAPAVPANPTLPILPRTPIVGSSSQVGSALVGQRDALLPGALQRPDILAAQASLEAAQAQAVAIGRSRRPLVEVQIRRGDVFASAATSLRAVVTLPLFDFGSIKREKRAAELDAQAQAGQVELLRQQAAAQIESALIRLEQQRRTVARYRDSLVPQTLELLRKTQFGYTAGASTFLEVLDAQRAARQIQTEYLQALVGVRTGEAALESAFGSGVPGAPQTSTNASPTGTLSPSATIPPVTTPPVTTPPVMTPPARTPSPLTPDTAAGVAPNALPPVPPSAGGAPR